MKTIPVLVVRIYFMESSGLLFKIMDYLKKEAKVRGISTFRAIQGFGETGNHSASLVDLSLDLPLTVEFFDHKEKVEAALEELSKMVKPEHIVIWEAKANQ